MGKRQYSDREKASALAALDANGGNVSRTARQLGIPRVTLLEWSKGRMQNPEVSELRQEKKRDLADRLEEIAHTLVDAIPGKIGVASLKDTAVSLGIAVEKSQLLKGEATSINKNLDNEEKREKVKAFLREQGILTSEQVQ